MVKLIFEIDEREDVSALMSQSGLSLPLLGKCAIRVSPTAVQNDITHDTPLSVSNGKMALEGRIPTKRRKTWTKRGELSKRETQLRDVMLTEPGLSVTEYKKKAHINDDSTFYMAVKRHPQVFRKLGRGQYEVVQS